jgi:hypothetical protein
MKEYMFGGILIRKFIPVFILMVIAAVTRYLYGVHELTLGDQLIFICGLVSMLWVGLLVGEQMGRNKSTSDDGNLPKIVREVNHE